MAPSIMNTVHYLLMGMVTCNKYNKPITEGLRGKIN